MADADTFEFLEDGLWWSVMEETINPTDESSFVIEEDVGKEPSKVIVCGRLVVSDEIRWLDSWFAIGVDLVGDDVIDWGLEIVFATPISGFCSKLLFADNDVPLAVVTFEDELDSLGSLPLARAREFPMNINKIIILYLNCSNFYTRSSIVC